MRATRTLIFAALVVALALTIAVGQDPEESPAAETPAESPAETPATLERGDALAADGDLAGAAKVYRAVTEAKPKNAEAWFKLGRALHQTEQYAEAAAAFEKAYKFEFTPKAALAFNAARTYAADGASGKATDFLTILVDGNNKSYYGPIKTAPEFESIKDDPAFRNVLDRLKPCNLPEHRQFDFWVGEWDVASPANPGWSSTNRITLIHNGCTLHERYESPRGYTGSSFSFYDEKTGKWYQTWIDSQGQPLFLSGGFKKPDMIMIDDRDPEKIQRVTWTRLKDKRVRQHWETSADGGETWTTAFDGYYTRRKKEENAK
jgi:tetratricopeptide (TPR) repeat protein